jgi:hypothetical protein
MESHPSSRDRSVGITTGYGLTGVRYLVKERDFSLHRRVQTGSRAHLSYTMGTPASIPGGKAVGA